MSYVEITWLTGFKLLTTSYIFPHFYVVPPLPFCNYLDTVTILIRRMIQSIVDSFPKLLRAVAASASVWEQAACSSLSSEQQSYEHLHEMTILLGTSGVAEPQGLFTDPLPSHRDSISRQVFKSGCPLGEKDLEFSRRKKAKRFPPPPLHFWGLYNNHISCLRTVSGKKKFWPIVLSYNVNYWSGSSEVFTTFGHCFDSL